MTIRQLVRIFNFSLQFSRPLKENTESLKYFANKKGCC